MATSAEITKYQRHREGHIEYIIKIVHNGKLWAIRKRFSEFVQLHEHLTKNGFVFDGALPKKTFWKKNDENKLKKRQRALQEYIDKMLRAFPLSENSLMKEFFEVESTFLQLAKRQSFQEVASAEKLAKLPKQLQARMLPIPYQRPKTLPATGARSISGSIQQFMSPAAQKTKSVSFSSFAADRRSHGRKESFAVGENSHGPASSTRDRKFSIDLFNLSGSHHADHLSAAASAVKKTAFLKATQVLWRHYEDDIEDLCAEVNLLRPTAVQCFTVESKAKSNQSSTQSSFSSLNPSSWTSSFAATAAAAATPPPGFVRSSSGTQSPKPRAMLTTGELYRSAVQCDSTRRVILEVTDRVQFWEENMERQQLAEIEAADSVVSIPSHTHNNNNHNNSNNNSKPSSRGGSRTGSRSAPKDTSSLSISLSVDDNAAAGASLVELEGIIGVKLNELVIPGFAPFRGSSGASATLSLAESDSATTVEDVLSTKS